MSQESQGLFSPFLRQQRYSHAAQFIQKNDLVLDLGCGAGQFGEYLPNSVRYFGIDAQQNWDDKKQNLFVVPVEQPLPKKLREMKFDVVVALAIIEHLEEPEKLFSTARKLLQPKGIFLLTTPRPQGRFFHDLGAKFGLFSHEASEEHKIFFNRQMLIKIANKEKFTLTHFEYFLAGFNQLAVFSLSN